MKKGLAIFLCLALFLSCGISAFAGAETSSKPVGDEESILFNYWLNNNSQIRPFGETREPDDVFLADMDNDNAPELVLFFSYLGPGGPTFAIYKNESGSVVHNGDFITSSGTGVNHNLSLVLEDDGDIKILDHYAFYPYGDLGEQNVTLAQYAPENSVTEKYAEVQYMEKINYTTDPNGENRVYCTKEEADAFFDDFYSEVSKNVIFSSKSEQKQSNDFFGIWTKQNELRNAVTVLVGGKKIGFDQPPVVVEDCILVPFRAIFEELGATVGWDNNTQTATAAKDGTTVSVTIGKTEMHKNGEVVALDAASQAKGGRTLVPLRVISESFGCEAKWDPESRTVIINTIN